MSTRWPSDAVADQRGRRSGRRAARVPVVVNHGRSQSPYGSVAHVRPQSATATMAADRVAGSAAHRHTGCAVDGASSCDEKGYMGEPTCTPVPEFIMCQRDRNAVVDNFATSGATDTCEACPLSVDQLRAIVRTRPRSASSVSCLPRRPKSFGDCAGPLVAEAQRARDVAEVQRTRGAALVPSVDAGRRKKRKWPPGTIAAGAHVGLQTPEDAASCSSRSSSKSSEGHSRAVRALSEQQLEKCDRDMGRRDSPALLSRRSSGLIERIPSGNQKSKKTTKPSNPFMHYEDKQLRLKQQRKLLQESSLYVKHKTAGLQYEAMRLGESQRQKSSEELYNMRMFYGPYSTALRSLQQRSRPRDNRRSGLAEEERPKMLGKRAQELSTAAASIREMQRCIEDSMAQARKNFGMESSSVQPRALRSSSWVGALRSLVREQNKPGFDPTASAEPFVVSVGSAAVKGKTHE